MFSLEDIEAVHGRLGRAETSSDHVRALAALGAERYDSFVSDGHTQYVGSDGDRVISTPAHEDLTVSVTSDRDAFLDHLAQHERGETTYVEMSHGMARSGVERWTVDMDSLTMSFYDPSGDLMLVQEITSVCEPPTVGDGEQVLEQASRTAADPFAVACVAGRLRLPGC